MRCLNPYAAILGIVLLLAADARASVIYEWVSIDGGTETGLMELDLVDPAAPFIIQYQDFLDFAFLVPDFALQFGLADLNDGEVSSGTTSEIGGGRLVAEFPLGASVMTLRLQFAPMPAGANDRFVVLGDLVNITDGRGHWLLHTAPVPEPSTLLLLSTGLAALAFRRRRT